MEVARRRAYEAEMARLEREAEERMKQRQEQEHMEIKRKHVRERLEELKKTPQGSKIFQNIDEEVGNLSSVYDRFCYVFILLLTLFICFINYLLNKSLFIIIGNG